MHRGMQQVQLLFIGIETGPDYLVLDIFDDSCVKIRHVIFSTSQKVKGRFCDFCFSDILMMFISNYIQSAKCPAPADLCAPHQELYRPGTHTYVYTYTNISKHKPLHTMMMYNVASA